MQIEELSDLGFPGYTISSLGIFLDIAGNEVVAEFKYNAKKVTLKDVEGEDHMIDVAELVAIIFGGYEKRPYCPVRFKDSNPWNCAIGNLTWKDDNRMKSPEMVCELMGRGYKQKEVAAITGYTQPAVSKMWRKGKVHFMDKQLRAEHAIRNWSYESEDHLRRKADELEMSVEWVRKKCLGVYKG